FHFSLYSYLPHKDLHSFPTRRSSDLTSTVNTTAVTSTSLIFITTQNGDPTNVGWSYVTFRTPGVSFIIQSSSPIDVSDIAWFIIDRKSTRLNSSHDQISYAVFCLKKK